ncbi:MFS transporter [Bacillus spongiae]|uniref:MFS transporter n=1 Tax=Bacillus spongiae TaxID=2683610 RepID=A0ABU8HEW0_9BACI
MKKWLPLIVLGAAQFLMVLDTSVMNVAISQLVVDFKTDVTQIQIAITFYALIMAAFMITGGKLGDVFGRRKTFGIGMAIYAVGSGVTAISQTVPVLIFGWSILEGIGASLVLPALAALLASNYKGRDRATAFGLVGGIAGVGVALGPIVGGWVTSNLSWRLVFASEVIISIAILLGLKLINNVAKQNKHLEIDWVGAILSGFGLGLVVYGSLKSSEWGMILPRNSPVEPLGFSLTPFVVLIGMLILYWFVKWQKRRESRNQDPLFHLRLLENSSLSSGLAMSLIQNIILAGVFFSIPLYLQLTIGLDAFSTGLRVLPISITLLLASMTGSILVNRYSPKQIIRISLGILLLGIFVLLSTIEPTLKSTGFALAMALLGVGIGLMASVLGNLTQSAVGDRDRSEVGALGNAGMQLGTALGTAIIGATVISSLANSFASEIADDERISTHVEQAIEVRLASGITFISGEQLETILNQSDVEGELIDAIVDNYVIAQLEALRFALFSTGILVIGAFFITSRLPDKPLLTESSNS